MIYMVDTSVLPPGLKSNGVRAWVGDSIVKETLIQQDGMQLISVVMLRDVYREIIILFGMPAGLRADPELVAECRRCAWNWFAEWERDASKFQPPAAAGSATRVVSAARRQTGVVARRNRAGVRGTLQSVVAA